MNLTCWAVYCGRLTRTSHQWQCQMGVTPTHLCCPGNCLSQHVGYTHSLPIIALKPMSVSSHMEETLLATMFLHEHINMCDQLRELWSLW